MRRVLRAVVGGIAFLAAGCASGPYAVPLMPPPLVLASAEIDPAVAARALSKTGHPGILYATQRPPAPDWEEPFYLNARGDAMRVGLAEIAVSEPDDTGINRLALSFDPARKDEIVLSIKDVREFGVLGADLTGFSSPETAAAPRGDAAFADEINRVIEASGEDDVYIYVHGYKVPFADPVLVAAELWHFLDYKGAFIAYSWPSTPSVTAYFSDGDTAQAATRGLRELLVFLSEKTRAGRVHLVGYSLGTRLVLDTLHDLALLDRGAQDRSVPLGHVILTGSDIDRGVLAMRLEDGVLDALDSLTVHLSDSDAALRFARFLFGRARLGGSWTSEDMPPHLSAHLLALNKLALIDVTGAAGVDYGNGHNYYRSSPWVSNDVIAQLRLDLPPDQRGLVRDEGDPIWHFAPDYDALMARARAR